MLRRYKGHLVSLFQRLHRLEANRVENRPLSLEIQEELIISIARAERRVRQTRIRMQEIKFDLNKRENTKEKSKELKQLYEDRVEYIDEQKKLIRVFRSVGDAIAFVYGDRHELKQLASGGDPGFITGKKGTRLERRILRASFEHGLVAVMNDLTNNLRRGDITIFRPDLWPRGDSPIMLVEAKSGRGGNKGRLRRQQRASEKIMQYIRTDVRESEGGRHLRIAPQAKSRHHFRAITNLLRGLESKSWQRKKVEDGLHYVAISCGAESRDIERAFDFLRGLTGPKLIIDANNFKNETLGYYPFPLCIRDAEQIYKFYNGEFVVNVVIDIDYVNESIENSGMKVELINNHWNILPLIPTDNWGERLVTPRAVGLMGSEFLSLRWFIDNILLGNLMRRLDQEWATQKA